MQVIHSLLTQPHWACLAKITAFSPLVGGAIAGLGAKRIGVRGAHTVTILGVAIALVAALLMAKSMWWGQATPVAHTISLYQWMVSNHFHFQVGFLLDPLSVLMAVTVTFVSLLVHIYSMGYMQGDPGYQRFFCYVSLFTFAMLMLVFSNNFMQLFFGWEGVGVVSYLLIGFWFRKPSAASGSLKAFLVNRVGDFGFLLGIGVLFSLVGSLNYQDAFNVANDLTQQHVSLGLGSPVVAINAICLLLFVGAMGKSAQIPLHVWLPESMEGPTPISALIHAATMVTAGIFMITRLSPLFELSPVARSVILIIGASGAFFLGLVGLVQHDIKRVVAYSTLSQLGYMIAATGASAYGAGMFHLVTHACFKALLFLGAGSVIIGLHHEQDMRKMGGLWRYMPVTYTTFLIGSLALSALPPFAGFYSKDAIISAVGMTTLPGAGFAHVCLVGGAFVTALYSFRALFLTFHTQERLEHKPVHESPWSVCLPLIVLAVPSVVIGHMLARPFLDTKLGWLGSAIHLGPTAQALAERVAEPYQHPWELYQEALHHAPLWLTLAGIFVAYICYQRAPSLPAWFADKFKWLYRMLDAKWGFDYINDVLFVRGVSALSQLLYRVADTVVIDKGLVLGSARSVGRLSAWFRKSQTGYVYHYALVMIAGLVGLLWWLAMGLNT